MPQRWLGLGGSPSRFWKSITNTRSYFICAWSTFPDINSPTGFGKSSPLVDCSRRNIWFKLPVVLQQSREQVLSNLSWGYFRKFLTWWFFRVRQRRFIKNKKTGKLIYSWGLKVFIWDQEAIRWWRGVYQNPLWWYYLWVSSSALLSCVWTELVSIFSQSECNWDLWFDFQCYKFFNHIFSFILNWN